MYVIEQTRFFYGPSTETELHWVDFPDHPEIYRTKEDAEAEIERLDSAVYHTSHNESGRPAYRVVEWKGAVN